MDLAEGWWLTDEKGEEFHQAFVNQLKHCPIHVLRFIQILMNGKIHSLILTSEFIYQI